MWAWFLQKLRAERNNESDAVLAGKEETIAELREQVKYLRRVIETRDRELEARTEEIRRRDHIIYSLTQQRPESPPAAAHKLPEAREEGEEAQETVVVAQATMKRPWRRRMLEQTGVGVVSAIVSQGVLSLIVIVAALRGEVLIATITAVLALASALTGIYLAIKVGHVASRAVSFIAERTFSTTAAVGENIFDTTAVITDNSVYALSTITDNTLCVISLTLEKTFDKINAALDNILDLANRTPRR